ncbi:hypothetical protein BD626DRAFT_456576 [Schizophyllum amplum]|uniref:Carbohydrate esterase family 16 protein n=1 Tax=Schizophyllum amplum TaxID=97359 RepID=A0A550CH42_9AGAR|nr:hypothetical protein BD626DRAFT_456576 [Auriculariopsis ampla]
MHPAGVVMFVFAARVSALAATFDWAQVQYVYAFGDSYSFVQGTRGYANYSFIGDLSHLAFTPEELLSTEIVARNTSSEGSNWLEFLTGCFSGLPSSCDIQLWDFAFAGADIDAALLPLHHDFTVPLVDQVYQWATYAADVLPHPAGKTLTTWWIGINDTGDTASNTTLDFGAFWEEEMSSYFAAVQKAYDSGLNLAHLFLNVPPGERSPANVNDAEKGALLKEHIDLFNAALDDHIMQFAATNPDATVLTFDANKWFNAVLDDPALYGFDNVTGYCTCEDPVGYFWYNTGHPTEAVHKLLAEAIKEQLSA